MNRVTLSGRLTRDVDLRQTQQGKSVCTFSIAVDRNNKNKESDFPTIVAWDSLAEFVAKYLGKGRKIIVDGKLRTRSYIDRDTQKTVYVTEILADSIEFADSKPQGAFVDTDQSSNSCYTDFRDEQYYNGNY